VDLVFENTAGAAALTTDEGKVSQVLRNFISNAIKFTPQGTISVIAGMEGETVRFEVRDTGIGIPPEQHDRIFEEFTQVENPLQEKFRGTGLGLPLSRNLAALLGGRVWVESQVGRGSSFFAEFPAVYRGEAARQGDLQARDFNRAPVLLVDDSADAFTAVEPFFRNSEFQLVHMDTLERASKWLAIHTPVAIVANMYLQGSATGAFFKTYKKGLRAGAKKPAVIAVSLYDDASIAALNGADLFFKQPYDPLVLMRDIRRLAEKEQPKRLLLVDDNEVSRYILRQLLDQPWLTLAEARNGEECLREIEAERPDALILDLIMPGLSGMEVLEVLRSREETRTLPVIVYTSKTLSPAELSRIERLQAAVVSQNDIATTLAPSKILNTLAAYGISQPEGG
jgi:CheY-like chemotaxis protein